MDIICAKEYVPTSELIRLRQLVAAGEFTETVDLRSNDRKKVYSRFTYQVTAVGITTNVILRVEGNMDGGDGFANLSDDGAEVMISGDGTYLLQFDSIGDVRFTRLYFVSEAGGTAAVLDVVLAVPE